MHPAECLNSIERVVEAGISIYMYFRIVELCYRVGARVYFDSSQ